MLPQQAAQAHVIISELEQPHRFDFVLQCKCGFQSHGYANEDKSVGDRAELARQAARTHLMQRHGAKPTELDPLIRVTSFTTAGGLTYEQLDLAIQQRPAAQEKPKPVQAPSPAQATAPPAPAPTAAPSPVPQIPAKPPQPVAQISALKGTPAKPALQEPIEKDTKP